MSRVVCYAVFPVEAEKISVGWVDPETVEGQFTQSLASVVGAMSYFGCFGSVHRASSSRPNVSRNMVIDDFLKTDHPWLWMVDSDMTFDEPDHPMRLWSCASEYGADIVAGLTFIHHNGNQPAPSFFYRDGEDIKRVLWPIPEEPMQILASGLASVLIHRRVFEAMETVRSPELRWFDEIPLDGAEGIAGEDVQFFVRANELGFKMMLEPNASTQHIKRIRVGRQAFDRFWELQSTALQEEEA